jgi:DNA polymerase
MLHGLYCGYTAGLAATAKALGLPEDKRKMSIGSELIKTFCMPVKTRIFPVEEPEKWELFKEYCRQDVIVEMEIERRLSAFPVPKQEQSLWELDQRINSYGVKLDIKLIEGALYCSEQVNSELMQEAIKLSGLNNPKSIKQLTEWLENETGERAFTVLWSKQDRPLGWKACSGTEPS